MSATPSTCRSWRRVSTGPAASRLATRPPTPIIFRSAAAATFDASALGIGDINGFPVRVKAFDYGVLSLAVTRPLPDSWDEAFAAGLEWQDNAGLAQAAERLCREMLSRIQATVSRPRDNFLSEDYVVFTVHPESDSATAEQLLALRGGQIAQLLRAERTPLSAQEREEVLRHRLSYLADDLVVPRGHRVHLRHRNRGCRSARDPRVRELAAPGVPLLRTNSSRPLWGGCTAPLECRGWTQIWFGRRFLRATRQLHALFIDVNELTDRTENALKLAGDVYAARLFTLAAARLGLDHWKGNVRDKLKTLDDIYRFAVEQTGHGARRAARADHRADPDLRAHPADALSPGSFESLLNGPTAEHTMNTKRTKTTRNATQFGFVSIVPFVAFVQRRRRVHAPVK